MRQLKSEDSVRREADLPEKKDFRWCFREKRKRRGSAVVLLCILFLSLTGALAVTYEAADRKTAICIAESAFDSAGRSILACYDKELFDRYSLFGFESREADTEKRIEKMVKESLEASRAGHCSVKSVEVEQAAYVLSEPDNMMIQLREIAKRSGAVDLLGGLKEGLGNAREKVKEKDQAKDKVRELEQEREDAKKRAAEEIENAKAAAEEAGDAEAAAAAASSTAVADIEEVEKIQNDLKSRADSIQGEPAESGKKGRTLRNGRITENLPSQSAGCRAKSAYAGGTVLKDLSSEGVGGMISDDLAAAIYIESYFGNHQTEDSSEESFFQCEQEYILYGCLSDDENYRKAYQSIFVIRSSINLAFLFTDPEKSALLTGAAEIMTPGAFAPLTRVLLSMVWSAVEAENDMKNLEAGNGVPMGKTPTTWMTDLDGAVSGSASGGSYLKIPGDSYMTYDRYLDMLLLTIDRDTKIYRIEDLIQMNLKGTSREEFTMVDHYTGLSLNAEAVKESHAAGIMNASAEINMSHTYLTGG